MASSHTLIHELALLQAVRPRDTDDVRYTLEWVVKSIDKLHEVAIRALAQGH